MKQFINKLRAGDLVEVRSPQEILATLDASGTTDQLPFMREMVPYCGQRFRVSRRAIKVCASGMKGGSVLRGFRTDDVLTLVGSRCSGGDHDGCQKGCMIFWREAWLRKVDENSPTSAVDPADLETLRSQLKTQVSPEIYFCQASELLRATTQLSKKERYTKWISEVRSGNCSPFEMIQRITVFLFWKLYRTLLGPYGRTKNKVTPTQTLDLHSGDLVSVKPMESIYETLDATASNRGLWFSPNMRLLCGKQQCVEKRIEKLIVDGTGEMRKLRNTVFLEGSHCGCSHIALGGCTREEYVYWREIWLQRCGESNLSKRADTGKEAEPTVRK